MPFIHGQKSRRTRRKNRQTKAKKKQSSKRSSPRSSQKSPKTKVKRSMAATKIQRTLKAKRTQRFDRQNRAALIRDLNLTPDEIQIYMHLYKQLGDNRDAPDIILQVIRQDRAELENLNIKIINKIKDLAEIFHNLQGEFGQYGYMGDESENLNYFSHLLKPYIGTIYDYEEENLPLYANEITTLLNKFEDKLEVDVIRYLEEVWYAFFRNKMGEQFL